MNNNNEQEFIRAGIYQEAHEKERQLRAEKFSDIKIKETIKC